MTTARRYTDEEREAGLAAIALHGSVNAAYKATGIPRRTLARWLHEADPATFDDARAHVAEEVLPRIDGLIDAYLGRLECEMHKLSTGQLPVGLAILLDKAKALRAELPRGEESTPRPTAEIVREIEAILASVQPKDGE